MMLPRLNMVWKVCIVTKFFIMERLPEKAFKVKVEVEVEVEIRKLS